MANFFSAMGAGERAALENKALAQQNQMGQLKLQQMQKFMELLGGGQDQGGGQSGSAQSADPLRGAIEEGEKTVLPGTPAVNIADQMDRLATLAGQAGMVETASKLATKGSTVRKNASIANKNALDSQIKDWNTASSLLGEAKDQDSWDLANDMYTFATGKKSPFSNRPYSPELVEQLQNGISSAKDKAITEYNRVHSDTSRAYQDVAQARVRLYNARASAIEKAGGTTAKEKSPELQAATDLINQDYRNVNPEEARNFGRQITERARDLMRQNPALTRLEATTKAYHEKRSSGAFGAYTPIARRQMKDTGYKLPNGQALTPGMIVGGYAYSGGPPSKPESWEEQSGASGDDDDEEGDD